VSVIRLRVRGMSVKDSLHVDCAEDCVIVVLDVASVLVLVPGEELGVACRWEMEYLRYDASDAVS
jgi:hypothetical protein